MLKRELQKEFEKLQRKYKSKCKELEHNKYVHHVISVQKNNKIGELRKKVNELESKLINKFYYYVVSIVNSLELKVKKLKEKTEGYTKSLVDKVVSTIDYYRHFR